MNKTFRHSIGSFFLLSALIALLPVRAQAAIAVDWGGDYAAGNRNMTITPTLSTGDYDYDGDPDDRASTVAWGTKFVQSSGIITAPTGKTATVYTAASIANLNSSVDPAYSLYRLNGGTSSDYWQVASNKSTGSTSMMRMATAFYAIKSDFLNGLDTTDSLSFANIADGAQITAGAGATVSSGGVQGVYFLVQNGASWYVTFGTASQAAATVSINPYSATWYLFDPNSSLFLNVDSSGVPLGTGVLGSTFTDIQAFGVYTEVTLFDGVSAADTVQVTAFSVALVPENQSVSLVVSGLAGLMVLRSMKLLRKRTL